MTFLSHVCQDFADLRIPVDRAVLLQAVSIQTYTSVHARAPIVACPKASGVEVHVLGGRSWNRQSPQLPTLLALPRRQAAVALFVGTGADPRQQVIADRC